MKNEERREFVKTLTHKQVQMLHYNWALWARDEQWPPENDWRVWVIMAGRGFGKTRAGAEWVRMKAMEGKSPSIAIVGDTLDDVRLVMIEGRSGILAVSPPDERPIWMPSIRSLFWPNGTVGRCYSAADPDQLRGPESHAAWCDEVAKWHGHEAWDNLMLGMRAGKHPQTLATTTPQPKQWLINLLDEEGVVTTTGRTKDNQANLAPSFISAMEARFRKSGLATQELDGILIREHPDALWSYAALEKLRREPPSRERLSDILIGVDPAVGGGDETGIIVVGRDVDNHFWVLEDLSLKAEPSRWASVIVSAAKRWRAGKIVVEVNQGGTLIEDLLKTKGVRWPIHAVRAKQGKVARAEPVAAAYMEGMVSHGGYFEKLETQLCGCVPGVRMSPSPDRLDALVWGLTALMRQERYRTNVIEF